MAGWMIATDRCYGCGELFSFDVERVSTADGRPVCPACCKAANVQRRERGLELLDERDSLDVAQQERAAWGEL